MDDLISRKALLETPWVLPDTMTRKQALECFVNILSEAPAVDAVPVVRCRECRHRQNTKECLMCFTEVVDVEDGKLYQFRDLTKDDGFCDRGERRCDNAAD